MRASFPVSDWSVIYVHRLNVAYSLNAENFSLAFFIFNAASLRPNKLYVFHSCPVFACYP